MALTVKQEKFIQNIIKGMSQREAYKNAYNAKYKDKAIDEKACVLFNSEKVQKRYEELMTQLEDKAIMSAKDRMKWLTDVINGNILEDVPVMNDIKEDKVNTIKCPTKIDTKLKALDTLNKMGGNYTIPIKGSITLNYEEALKKVSEEDEY